MEHKPSIASSSSSSFKEKWEDTTIPPPAYTETTITGSTTLSTIIDPSSSPSDYYSSQISSQLSILSSQINAFLAAKTYGNQAVDEQIITLLIPHIGQYFTDFAHSGLADGKLVLIPAGAVSDEKALPAGVDFQDSKCFERVVRVRDDSAEKATKSTNAPAWNWQDHERARRIACYLHPKPVPKVQSLPPRQPAKKHFWSLSKNSAGVFESKGKDRATEQDEDEKVHVDVRAEAIVFRTQSELGIYGTERGWAIVMRLGVNMK